MLHLSGEQLARLLGGIDFGASEHWQVLEHCPSGWLDLADCADMIRVTPFRGVPVDMARWRVGRVFCPTLEVAWEPALSGDGLTVVWTGVVRPPADMALRREVELGQYWSEEHSYLCWGTRLSEATAARLGLDAATSFVELQVPRVLRYEVPAVPAGGRICVAVREWFDGCDRVAWRCLRIGAAQ